MLGQLPNAVALASVYTLFTLGLTLCWGVLNVLNLAHGALFAASAFLAYRLTQVVPGIPLWALLPIMAVGIGLLSALVQVLVFAPIRARGAGEHDVEMRTLIAGVTVAAAITTVGAILTEHQPFALPREALEVTTFDVLGAPVTNVQVLLLVAAVVLACGLLGYVRYTRDGRALRAVAVDRRAARLMGIPVRRLEVQALALSGALAGVAGLFFALYLGAGDAHMGDTLLLKAFAIVILAGVGSLGGAVVFAFVLAFVEAYVGYYAGADLRDVAAFALIIVMLLVRPTGLFPRAIGQRA
ncbi:branched-chain amino acid ABC transporter permease [Pseudonocardia xishanensis]|uniref:Branched-chain amino acid ABC transporter permease n=1 Tax=Pseudonocardia xishanensis TaxID=630995 RepID=A0ABP8RXB8_9PSEU